MPWPHDTRPPQGLDTLTPSCHGFLISKTRNALASWHDDTMGPGTRSARMARCHDASTPQGPNAWFFWHAQATAPRHRGIAPCRCFGVTAPACCSTEASQHRKAQVPCHPGTWGPRNDAAPTGGFEAAIESHGRAGGTGSAAGDPRPRRAAVLARWHDGAWNSRCQHGRVPRCQNTAGSRSLGLLARPGHGTAPPEHCATLIL